MKLNSDIKKYFYMLTLGLVLLLYSLTEIIIFACYKGRYETFSGMQISAVVFLIVFIGMLIYSIITRKIRKWYDYTLASLGILLCATDVLKFYIVSFLPSTGPNCDKYLTGFYFVYYRVEVIMNSYVNGELISKVLHGNLYSLQLLFSLIIIIVAVSLIIRAKLKRQSEPLS